MRVTEDNFGEVAAWCQGEVQDSEGKESGNKKFIKVRVVNPKNPRQTKAFVGDWILYTDRGYKVYTPKAFHASFDEVKEKKGEDAMPSPQETPPITERRPSEPAGVTETDVAVEPTEIPATPSSQADEMQAA